VTTGRRGDEGMGDRYRDSAASSRIAADRGVRGGGHGRLPAGRQFLDRVEEFSVNTDVFDLTKRDPHPQLVLLQQVTKPITVN